MRLAVIGDVGGHLDALEEALWSLGADPEAAELPDDLVVCQVGDLVHRGPDSPGVVGLVDRLMAQNPGRWVQLAGNHEAQYLQPPRFKWYEALPDETVATLRRWWEDGSMQLAAAFETDGVEVRRPGGERETVGAGELLVTHAGLTAGLWKRLGAPRTAAEAARLVNEGRHEETSPVWDSGRMLDSLNRSAGVVWAEAANEVYDSWRRAEAVPFHQAHGHSSAMWWGRMRWSSPAEEWRKDERYGVLLHADPMTKHVRAELGGGVLWGVDPGHGVTPVMRWAPLVLQMRQQ